MNEVMIAGNIADDPFIKSVKGGGKLASMRLATDEYLKDGKQTEWHNVVCWGKLADTVENIVKKGDFVIIMGYLKTRVVDTGECGNRYYTEVVARKIKRVNKLEKEEINDDSGEIVKGGD